MMEDIESLKNEARTIYEKTMCAAGCCGNIDEVIELFALKLEYAYDELSTSRSNERYLEDLYEPKD